MSVDAEKVLVGAPEQSVTGAIAYADIGTTLPTSAVDTLDAAFDDAGYVSEDGLSMSLDYSDTDIMEWGGASVRTILESFTGEVSFTFLQTGKEELEAIFGAGNVTETAATASHGYQLSVAVGAELAPARSYVFRMKDGDNRVMLVLPNAQIIMDGEVSFVSNDAIKWPARIKANKDSSGKNVYIYTDDGKTS